MEEDDEQTKALPDWVKLEYSHMLTLVGSSSSVHFTSLSQTSIPPLESQISEHKFAKSGHAHKEPILELLAANNIPQSRVCLLDPRAPKVLAPEDAESFDVFLYGGILGDDPPRDRTGELRKLGFEGRHLLEKQMTTDTAVGVTKIVVEDQGGCLGLILSARTSELIPVPIDKIPFVDFPTISFGKHESIEMPFRESTRPHTVTKDWRLIPGYVKDAQGEPILPPGMKEHLKADLDRTIEDF